MSEKPINARMIPSMFTLANLCFGFLALVLAMEGNYIWGAAFILLAAAMDSMDGKVARKLSVSSNFGKELDSLSDVVSFGVAPAFLTYHAVLQEHLSYYGLVISLAFVLCGAVRLARFNVLNISTHFVGVPITFAGGFMAFLLLFYQQLSWDQQFLWVIYPVAMLALAFLMVSTFKVPKLGK